MFKLDQFYVFFIAYFINILFFFHTFNFENYKVKYKQFFTLFSIRFALYDDEIQIFLVTTT